MSSSFPVESLETFIVATLESSVVMTAETQENYTTTVLSSVFLVFLVTLVEFRHAYFCEVNTSCAKEAHLSGLSGSIETFK